MKRRSLAIAGSVAALSLVAAPVAAAASAPQHGAKVESRTDRHVDKTRDRTSTLDRSSKDMKLDR